MHKSKDAARLMKRMWKVRPDIGLLFAVTVKFRPGLTGPSTRGPLSLTPASADVSLGLFFDPEDGGDTFL
jgi:hypothetical protein